MRELIVFPSTPLAAGDVFEVVVAYRGTPAPLDDAAGPFALGWQTRQDCEDAADEAPPTETPAECSYDPVKARDCLNEWTALDCDDYPSGFPTCSPFTCESPS